MASLIRYSAESQSALAMLAKLTPPGGGRLSLCSGGRLSLDPLLRLELHRSPDLGSDVLEEMMRKWRKRYREYSKSFSKLKRVQEEKRQHGRLFASEGEAAGGGRSGGKNGGRSGGGSGVGSGVGSEVTATTSGVYDRDVYDPEFMDQYYELVASIREHELLEPYERERRAFSLAEPPRLLAEACAIYEVVYSEVQAKAAAMEHVDPRYHTAFAWHMCGDLLLYVRKARLSRARDPSRALFSGLVR